jgi:hypothetical protein
MGIHPAVDPPSINRAASLPNRLCANDRPTRPPKQVDQYANLFDGARKEVGTISSEESIEGRRSQYQTMITNFYDLVRSGCVCVGGCELWIESMSRGRSVVGIERRHPTPTELPIFD